MNGLVMKGILRWYQEILIELQLQANSHWNQNHSLIQKAVSKAEEIYGQISYLRE